MTLTIIPSTESRGPQLGSVRRRLTEISSALGVRADVGSGLGPAELEMLVRDLQGLARRTAENDESGKTVKVVEAVALAFQDIDEAETRLREAKAVLARQINDDAVDKDGRFSQSVTAALSLCLRAQSTVGATRLVRT